MKSYSTTKRMATIVMALILTLMMSTMAIFATVANTDGYDDSTGQPINTTSVPAIPANGAHVSKIVKYNRGHVFNLSFNYAAAPTQVVLTQTWDGTATESTMTQPTSACPAVTISPVNVVVDSNTVYSTDGIRVPKADMSDAELVANTQGVITFGTTPNTGAAAFPHAGVYAYTISEVAGATTGLDGNASGTDKLTYDTETYLMRVYVVNDVNGLAIQSITFQNKDGEKVSRSEVLFENTYIETADALEVKKMVEGSGADMSKQFNFTVNFTAPTLINTMADGSAWNPEAITVTRYDAAGTQVTTPVTVNAQGEASFTLAHDEEMVFSNLPVGAHYIVQETGLAHTGYTPQGVAVQNGQSRTPHTGTRDTDYTSHDTYVGEDANSYTITNTADDITITGLVIDNMPIILLAILAVAGVIGYRAMRRKVMAH